MRAIMFSKYGEPTKVMSLVSELEIPKPKGDEVLVKIQNSSVNAADIHMVRANYLIIRLLLGLFKPSSKRRTLGMDIAGTIIKIGKDVEEFMIGDHVAADLRTALGGGFAEYAVVKASSLVKKPSGVTFEQAATVPISGQAAMMGIIHCNIKAGDKILINGASGGVGMFGVLIAKALGVHVTAICSTEKVSEVKSWGADEIIDYTVTSIKELGPNSYDAVFDTACFEKPNAYNSLLKERGIYILVGGDFYRMLKVKIFGKCYARKGQTFKSLTQDIDVNENIKRVFEMIVQGKINPSIKKVITLKEVPNAIDDLINRKVVGKIIVNNQR